MPPLLRSLLWSGADTLGTVLIGLASVLVVARLVGPAEFGLGALGIGLVLLVLLPVGALVHDPIVQRPEVTPLELDSAFSLSIAVAAAACALLVLVAEPIARALGEPKLAPVTLGLLPMVLFTAASSPLLAERRRAMEFGAVGRQQLATRSIGLAVAVGLAAAGAGVWAVVAQQVVTPALLTLSLLLTAPRRPRLRLSLPAVMPFLAFSRHVVGTQILLQAADRLFLFAAGHAGGATGAGYWGAASRMVESLAGIVNTATYHVALAHFSRLQGERARLGQALAEGQALLLMLLVPVAAALAGSVEPLIQLLLGEDWLPVGKLVPWLLAGTVVSSRVLLPGAALSALGLPRANLAATAATGVAGLLGCLGLAWSGLQGLAVVRGAAPFAGWALLARRTGRELPLDAVRAALDLGTDLLALSAGLLVASALAEHAATAALPVRCAVQAGAAALAALTVVALARPAAPRLLLARLHRAARAIDAFPSARRRRTRAGI